MEQKSVTRKAIAAEMAVEFGMTKKRSGEIIDFIFDRIAEQMRDGEVVSISNFGKFMTAKRSERVGMNPFTGEKVDLDEKTLPRFKASKTLKAYLNGEEVEPEE